MNQRLAYHVELLNQLALQLAKLENADQEYNQENTILQQLGQLIESLKDSSAQQYDSAVFEGQQWFYRFLTHNPELAPAIHRDLLWFFGGECLHFMPDEEIEKYQMLDDAMAEAMLRNVPFNYTLSREQIFK
ncbi:hypothetical protein A9R00_11295 [Oleispira antarctica]|uniref:Dehydrogenase n=1 Tax=Oleispira antarctica TaxID=188908 RepID=A0A1Y5HM46_OLEAN|nr:hypothetical protein A9R00_11295 [Oleispira antarctica]